ncbi:MAG: hypothetical protein M3164_07360 [Actinomycetota bacterium]|nr:hypothetical protein [Actinomycetota bacterium]
MPRTQGVTITWSRIDRGGDFMGDQESAGGTSPERKQPATSSIYAATVQTEKGKDVTPPPTSRNAEETQRDARTN